ncbi:MAG TPA: tetratricopeptide repeat protein [Candidatus Limnocylindrales bacterium]|nr:tetratricopeptide repeat protein [Candidatus Limnocylindrales bacterium]
MPDIEDLVILDAWQRMVPADACALRDAVGTRLTELDGTSEPASRLALSRRIGSGLTALGDFDSARRVLGEALELALGLDDPRAEVAARINLGDALRYAGDLEAAAAQYEPALALARRAVPDRVDFALQHYGKHLIDAGRTGEAAVCLREALRLRQAKGDRALIESTVKALGLIGCGP